MSASAAGMEIGFTLFLRIWSTIGNLIGEVVFVSILKFSTLKI